MSKIINSLLGEDITSIVTSYLFPKEEEVKNKYKFVMNQLIEQHNYITDITSRSYFPRKITDDMFKRNDNHEYTLTRFRKTNIVFNKYDTQNKINTIRKSLNNKKICYLLDQLEESSEWSEFLYWFVKDFIFDLNNKKNTVEKSMVWAFDRIYSSFDGETIHDCITYFDDIEVY